jgi:DNA-binding transcriptional MerR regulator
VGHQPADVDGHLLGLRPGQQHAVRECVQEAAFADPAVLVDDAALHDRIAWNAILRAAHGRQFFTDAPLAPFPVSWQDTGSGLFALATVAVALCLGPWRSAPAHRPVVCALLSPRQLPLIIRLGVVERRASSFARYDMSSDMPCDAGNPCLKVLEVLTVDGVSAPTTRHTYSIKEAAALTGLPASTLRYYETIGVIAPISRGASSKHRVYTEEDLDLLTWVACLSATGMSVRDMRRYVANGALGPAAAGEQIELLRAQQQQLALEAEFVALRRRYVRLKIDYWQAVEVGDDARAEQLSNEARTLADELKKTKKL